MEPRQPEVGDFVSVQDHHGIFTVIDVRKNPNMVTVRLESNDSYTMNVPWGLLVYLSPEVSH